MPQKPVIPAVINLDHKKPVIPAVINLEHNKLWLIWIMKPAAKSQGKGIFLFRRLKDITDWKKVYIYFFFFTL
jgi:hypothetical protein